LDRTENRTIRRVTYTTNSANSSSRPSSGVSGATSVIFKDYEVLDTQDFDPNRKRMSIVVKDLQLNQHILFCKGADVAIFERAICGTTRLYDNCLQSFSENGWRTLVCAYKLITSDEYTTYKKLTEDANNDIVNREASLAKVYDQIESGLCVLGVTAVEDKLQENVEGTLSALRKAGIRIWVVTGDKLETAMNISESCKHFSPDMKKHVLRGLKNSIEIKKSLLNLRKELIKEKLEKIILAVFFKNSLFL
jgi:magnesium-transporting ATPase (P-type)